MQGQKDKETLTMKDLLLNAYKRGWDDCQKNGLEIIDETFKTFTTMLNLQVLSCTFTAIIMLALGYEGIVQGLLLSEILLIPSILAGGFLSERRRRK